MTADELLQLPNDGMRYELVQGELRKMSPSGARHGRVAAEIVGSLIAHMKRQRTGAIYSSETGFRIARQPDTVRAPDAAFVRSERVTDTAGFFDGPPDAAQPGTTALIETNDTRALFANWRAGLLSTGQNIACGSLACAAYTELDVSAYPKISTVDDFTISGTGTSSYFPAVDTNIFGKKVMVFTQSNAVTMFPSAAFVGIPPASTCTNCIDSAIANSVLEPCGLWRLLQRQAAA